MVTNQGNLIGLSNTSDYQHRPPAFIDMNLYDWICLATKQKRKQKISEKIEKETDEDREFIDDDDYDELDIIGDDTSNDIHCLNNHNNDFVNNDSRLVNDSKMDDEVNILYSHNNDGTDEDELNIEDGEPSIEKWHSFISSHPQFATHQVTICSADKAKIPDL